MVKIYSSGEVTVINRNQNVPELLPPIVPFQLRIFHWVTRAIMPNIMLGVKETIFLIGLEQKKVKVPIATNKQRVRPWYGPVIKLQNLATSPLTRGVI